MRKSGDYIPKMIRMAGGEYVPSGLTGEDNALSTMNMDLESFYAAARDADYLIYNSTVDGELDTVEELLKKSELLGDFKAVKEGHVYCTGKNMYQETSESGTMVYDLYQMYSGREDGMEFLYKLK